MKSKEFNDILNECLERLLGGEAVEQCLQDHPRQAAELEPLLQTALAARSVSTIKPRADFKARARYQFLSTLSGFGAKRERAVLSWLPRWATVAAVALVVLMAGGGTVLASGNSMPDSPLYQVKLATEQVRIALTPSVEGKAELCLAFADRRVAEIVYMAVKGDAQQIGLITQRLDDRLLMLASLAPAAEAAAGAKLTAPSVAQAPPAAPSAPPAAREDQAGGFAAIGGSEVGMAAARSANDDLTRLQAAMAGADEAVKAALQQAIAVLSADYQAAIEAWH